MKRFSDYLAEATCEHNYFIKFAIKPSEDQVSSIETWLRRYDLRSMTPPVLFEDGNKDFIDVRTRSVHSMRISLGMPVSQYILLQDLKSAAGISEKMMVVRGENEPIERYSQIDAWERKTDADARDRGDLPSARLSTDRSYNDSEQPPVADLFGNEYNKKLLTYLAGVADARPTMEVDPPSPLFSWIQMEDVAPGEPVQDTSNFNAHIKGAPMPVNKGGDECPVDERMTNNAGTMSDDAIPQVRFFKNGKTGKPRQEVMRNERN